MALGNEVAIRDSAVDPEDEEEEDLVDPRDAIKERCESTKECQKYFDELQRCNERVASKSNTTETCNQELYDFVHCVDHCIAKSVFDTTK